MHDVVANGSILAAPSGSAVGTDLGLGVSGVSGTATIVGDTSCSIAGAANQQGVDPLLGPLAANGGPTATHLPTVGSPAIGVIPSGTPGLCDASTPSDQRGVARPQGGACDVGAVEQ